jgi:hypothetical protein
MPVQIVLDSQTGLLGAAALAAREAQFLQPRKTSSTSRI